MSLLILGGTADGRKLADSLHNQGISVIYSVAGLVRMPAVSCEVVSGGFSQFGGLAAFIDGHGVTAILDVTHPYAQTMSAKAVAAAGVCAIPCWRFHRRPWRREAGDDWQVFANWQALAPNLAGFRQVLLTCGQLSEQQVLGLAELGGLRGVLRTAVAPKYSVPDNLQWCKAIGPFSLEEELALMKNKQIDVLVSKNSGGDATVAKLHAARALHIPVLMLARPALPAVTHQFATYEACQAHVLAEFAKYGESDAV